MNWERTWKIYSLLTLQPLLQDYLHICLSWWTFWSLLDHQGEALWCSITFYKTWLFSSTLLDSGIPRNLFRGGGFEPPTPRYATAVRIWDLDLFLSNLTCYLSVYKLCRDQKDDELQFVTAHKNCFEKVCCDRAGGSWDTWSRSIWMGERCYIYIKIIRLFEVIWKLRILAMCPVETSVVDMSSKAHRNSSLIPFMLSSVLTCPYAFSSNVTETVKRKMSLAVGKHRPLSHCIHLIAKFDNDTVLARAMICVLRLRNVSHTTCDTQLIIMCAASWPFVFVLCICSALITFFSWVSYFTYRWSD
jgi:hypothetical protein